MLAERISNDTAKLRLKFRRKRPKGDTLLNSLKTGHGVKNFHVTHLDPILFSSLIYFKSIGDEFSPEHIVSPTYKELGIKDEDDFRDIRRRLMKLVRREVSLYTSKGNGRSEVLVDESTLWWAVYELVRYYGDEFYIGNPKICGMSFAAYFVKQFAAWTKKSTAYPNFGMAQYEMTCEVHCPLRTQLLIAVNGLNMLGLPWREAESKDVLTSLKELIDWSLSEALTNWENSPQLQKHAYFIGLALEVLCHRQAILGDLDLVERSPKREVKNQEKCARMWTNGNPKGTDIEKASFDRELKRKDAYDIFVVDNGEFRSGHSIGDVWIRGKPNAMLLKERAERIMIGSNLRKMKLEKNT